MNGKQPYWIIFTIFLVSLAAEIGLIVSQGRDIFGPELEAAAKQMLSVYAVHFAVILGGIFANKDADFPVPPPNVGWAAIALSSLWNVLVLWRVVWFAFDSGDKIEFLREYLQTVPAESAFLVTGMLTYFFATSSKKAGRKGRSA